MPDIIHTDIVDQNEDHIRLLFLVLLTLRTTTAAAAAAPGAAPAATTLLLAAAAAAATAPLVAPPLAAAAAAAGCGGCIISLFPDSCSRVNFICSTVDQGTRSMTGTALILHKNPINVSKQPILVRFRPPSRAADLLRRHPNRTSTTTAADFI